MSLGDDGGLGLCALLVWSRSTDALGAQALTPLTIGRSHVRGALLGALWGFGHSIGQLLLGLLMVILKVGCVHALSCCNTYRLL